MPPTLSEVLAATTTTAIKSPRVSTMPKRLAAVDLLSGVKTLGFLAYRGRGTDRAGIDDAGRRFPLASLFLAHRRGETSGDPLPGAVFLTRPGDSGAPCSSSDTNQEGRATRQPVATT